MSKFISILFLALIAGCAPKAPSSKVSFSLGLVTGSANFPGGLMLAASGPGGKKIVRKVGANDNIELDLPNGVWSFAVVGWKSTANIFEGLPFCDFKASQDLNGGEIDIAFSTTQAKCLNTIFGQQMHSSNTNEFVPLRFNTCLAIKNHIEEDGATSVPQGLECGTSDTPMNGGTLSYKIVVGEKFLNGSVSDQGLTSDCVDVSGSRALSSFKLPYGSNVFQMPYFVKAYTAGSCGGDETTYSFQNGFKTPAIGNVGAVTPNLPEDVLDIYLHTDACNAAQIALPAMGAGAAYSGGPYLICKKEHFENIADTASGYESEASYIIGKDIDFAGGHTPVPNFKGSLDGGGFTLSNGVDPLFANLQIPATGDNDGYIHDFNIENFILSTSATSGAFGILSNTLTYSAAADDNRLEISAIKLINSSISAVHTSYNGSIGALIGHVNLGGAAGGDIRLFVRKIESIVDVTNDTTNVGGFTGGLFGKVEGPPQTDGMFSLEKSNIGVDPEDLFDSSERIEIVGHTGVGGIAGSAKNFEIRSNVHVYSELDGISDVGGAVGFANENTRIQNTYLNTTIATARAASVPVAVNNVAGIVGKVNDYESVHISGVISKFVIAATANQVNNVGGFVGHANSGGSSGLFIENSRANISVHANGNYHGGMIGQFNPTSPSGDIIVGSVVKGVLGTNTVSSANHTKGGFAGSAFQLKISRSIVEDVSIVGNHTLGGAYGFAGSASEIHEAEIDVDILANSTGTALLVGGLIGSNITSSAANLFTTIRLNADIDLVKTTPNCLTVGKCGNIMGQNLNNSLDGFNGILWDGVITKDINGTPLPVADLVCGNSGVNCISATNFDEIYKGLTSSPHCDNLDDNYPFEYDGSECRTLFEKKWGDYGHDDDAGRYLAGSSIEPFKINTAADWNAIGDDAFLMNKSLLLTTDIDFAGGSFTPLGRAGGGNSFKGHLISNGHKLLNITYSTAAEFEGVFPKIEDGAQIGEYDQPLVIDTLNLNCNVQDCGAIGNAGDSQIYLHVKNGVVNGTGNNNIGGLVGLITEGSAHVRIEKSGFEGEVIGNQFVGGLVGQMNTLSGSLNIDKSFAKITAISATSDAGGLVGSVDGGVTSGSFNISDSYVTIDLNNDNAGEDMPTGTTTGFIVGALDADGSNIENVYVDYSQTTQSVLPGNVTMIDGGASSYSGSVYYVKGGKADVLVGAGISGPSLTGHTTQALLSSSALLDDQDEFVYTGGIVKLEWE